VSKASQSEIADAREESNMISQIRIYTINKGEMDNFLKHFKEEIMPLHEKIGVPIVGSWVNRPQNEFIWVRTYKDKAEIEAKTKEFQTAVAAAGVKLGGNVAKMEVREAESMFA
jgi:NIPSNAP